MDARFRVLGRWPTTPMDEDPIKFEVRGKDCKDKKAVLAFVGFMLDSIPPYQISITDLKQVDEYFTDAVLLDAYDPKKYGGTGLTFDWNIIGHIGKRIFLAGGINPDNAVAAVELGVYGIDVCSGVESEPGKKDRDKMKQLFDNIRHLRA